MTPTDDPFGATVPARFTSRAFARYAPAIGHIVAMWPGPVTLDPRPLSVETFSHRLRDAITAAQRFNYTDPSVDAERFAAVAKDIVVSARDGTIYAGARWSVTAPLTPVNPSPVFAVQGTIEWTDSALIAAAAQLLSHRIITGPFKIVNMLPSPTSLDALREFLSVYDVAVERIDDTSATML